MNIEIQVGDKLMLIRDGEGCVELCKQVRRKSKDTEEVTASWQPFNWFASVNQALDKLLQLKINSSDANTLHELKAAITRAKEELLGYYS